jgi:putative transposase
LAYCALFNEHLAANVISDIRVSTYGNFALGDDRFKQQVAAILGRPVMPAKAGRPAKKG